MHRFITAGERESILEARSFHDLLGVALPLAARLPKPTIQLSGPVTTGGHGSVEKNVAVFRAATELLGRDGHTVFDIMVFHEAMVRLIDEQSRNTYCFELLEIFFAGIIGSGHISAVHFLPGWEQSTGSRWERDFCVKNGIPIVDLSSEQITEFEGLISRAQ